MLGSPSPPLEFSESVPNRKAERMWAWREFHGAVSARRLIRLLGEKGYSHASAEGLVREIAYVKAWLYRRSAIRMFFLALPLGLVSAGLFAACIWLDSPALMKILKYPAFLVLLPLGRGIYLWRRGRACDLPVTARKEPRREERGTAYRKS